MSVGSEPTSDAGDFAVPNAAEAESGTPIRFVFRGQLREVNGIASTATLLDWLRISARACGTKEGCAEGDCGACTVVLAELDPAAPDGVSLRAINSCIHLLAMIDGKAVLTVEDLAGPHGPLHPVQQAMVECHGSQCGFCTPGFVMSLFDLYESRNTAPDRAGVCHALAGNLCRCTGYQPILQAAARAFDLPRRALDRAPLREALTALASRSPLDYRAPAAAGGGRVQAPATLDDLATTLANAPHARILAGATDIGLWITKQDRALPHLIHLDRVAELHALGREGNRLVIGAAVTHRVAWPHLVAAVPALAELARRFAAPTVCNAGTLGGNIANGSPIGDAMPALLALDARLRLQRGARVREVALEAFYTGYLTTVLEPGEFLREVLVPVPGPASDVASYKVSKRYDQDISALCGGFRIDRQEGVIVAARVAFGGMAAVPRRATSCEEALVGGRCDEQTLLAAQAALALDFQPLGDLRASAAYRSAVAGRLLQRWWYELAGTAAPLNLSSLEAET
jgi:xanthine dehydrogenase small subunit